MLREGWTAAVEHDHVFAVFQDFLMGVTGDHNIHWCGEKPLQVCHRAEAASERRLVHEELVGVHASLHERLAEATTRAQVLLFIGRGPAIAENLPTGVAHEFVARLAG